MVEPVERKLRTRWRLERARFFTSGTLIIPAPRDASGNTTGRPQIIGLRAARTYSCSSTIGHPSAVLGVGPVVRWLLVNRPQYPIPGPDVAQLQDNKKKTPFHSLWDNSLGTFRCVVDVDSNFEPTQPELRITGSKKSLTRAADLGVNIDTLANKNLFATLLGGEIVEFKDGERISSSSACGVYDAIPEPNPWLIGDLLCSGGARGPGGRSSVSDGCATLFETTAVHVNRRTPTKPAASDFGERQPPWFPPQRGDRGGKKRKS